MYEDAAHVNPLPGDSWIYFGPTLGSGWGAQIYDSIVDVGALIGGSDLEDPMPLIKSVFEAPEFAGRTFLFRRNRAWVFPTRPTGAALGPQGQYLTPPRQSRLIWEREWDFSAFGSAGTISFIRRESSYGTAVAVSTEIIGGTTIAVNVTAGQGSQFIRGQRVLLRATAGLTDMALGAFTLNDAEGTPFCAKAEDMVVVSSTSSTVTFYMPPRWSYPAGAAPVLQAYIDEPEISFINPMGRGPGSAIATDVFLSVFGGRYTTIEGGRTENVTRPIRIYSSFGGYIDGHTMICADPPSGNLGGGITVGDATSNFKIKNMNIFGGGQPINLAGSSYFYGIHTNVDVEHNYIRGSTSSAIVTHSLGDSSSFRWNVIENCALGIDVRLNNAIITDNKFRYIAGRTIYARIRIQNYDVSRNIIDTAGTGIMLDNTGAPVNDNVPANWTIRSNNLYNIGGIGSHGAINMMYTVLHGGSLPTLGYLEVSGNYVEQVDNTVPVYLAGKWTGPVIRDNVVGGSGVGRAYILDDNAISGAGLIDPQFYNNRYAAAKAVPLVFPVSGKQNAFGNGQIGVTASFGKGGVRPGSLSVTTSTTLTDAHLGMGFNNAGATALVIFTLPGAASDGREFYFEISDVDGIKLQATATDTFQIGSGAAGAGPGSLTSTTIGAWCRIKGVTATKWVVEVNDAANWTLV